MNEKSVVGEVEVEVTAVEMIDLGDASIETKQPHPFVQVKDNAISWTYFGLVE